MISTEQDAKLWVKEKLLQTSGDAAFLAEKVHKWHSLAYFWEHRDSKPSPHLTPAINEKMVNGDTLEEWLNAVYTPLEATILAAATVSWEFIIPLLTETDYHEEKIDLAISLVDIKMTMSDDINGTFTDIIEPDLRFFDRDVTLLDMINILDREVCIHLYGDDGGDCHEGLIK